MMQKKKSSQGTFCVFMISLSSLWYRQFYSAEKHDDTHTLGEIGEKARSTAEEFLRWPRKTDDVAKSAKETLHETKETVVGESQEDKETFKRRVEEGRYDHRK